MNTKNFISRRNFLKVSALSGGGLLIGFSMSNANGDSLDVSTDLLPEELFTPNAYVSIGADNIVTLFSPNPEIGQGVRTSLPIIVAEELGCDWQNIKMIVAPVEAKYGQQSAGGSGALRGRFTPLRKAGAAAREMLITAAATVWNVPVSECRTENGTVIHTSGKKLTFGEVATQAASLPVPADPTLKNPKDFTIIGTRVRDLEAAKIVTGQPLYGIDTRREGMQFAVVARPPAYGKTIKSFDASEAKKIKGVVNVVRVKDSVAVLATSTWAAKKGRDALVIQYDDATPLESSSEHEATYRDMLEKGTSTAGRTDGDALGIISGAAKVLDVIYEVPALSHAQMEPLNYFADVRDNKVELYGPSQVPGAIRNQVSRELSIPVDNISVGIPRQGGSFGRKGEVDNGVEAALISAAAKSPVQVQWMREDDMQNDFYRTSGMYRFRAALDQDNLLAWQQSMVTLGRRGGGGDAYTAGALANYRSDARSLTSNIPTGWWRAPGANILAFAAEGFMDEVCTALKKDPIAFRLELFDKAAKQPVGRVGYNPQRFKGVVELVAKMSNWGTTTPGTFRGMATWFSFGSYAAHVVDITMIGGMPRVQKVYCAVDCGRVVSLSGAENQVQGAAVDGLGHALMTKLTFEKGVALENNFNTYKLWKMKDTPLDVEVQFVKSEEEPSGLGEPGLPPAAPALASALFAATGKRYRKMPFDVEAMN